MKLVYTLFFLLITFCILTNSELSLAYALLELNLWFEKMVPALLPFMILSGIMIRMNLTRGFSRLLYPVIKPLYHISENGCYAMIMGYLCGFPMGAKTTADLLKRKMLSRKEAMFLFCFCNNIGPVYFCSFVLPLLNRKLILPYVLGMYGIPLLYGLLLRFTRYADLSCQMPEQDALSDRTWLPPAFPEKSAGKLLGEIDEAITSSVQNILSLGGYMILFGLFNLPVHILCGGPSLFLAPFLEITGGIKLSGGNYPLYILLLLPFGGLSCIAQTYSCIKQTSLSIKEYTIHKLLLTAVTGLYYLGWFLLFPSCFLR